ncbi:DegT/DnrJ/EryC1/StrS family aminotransferase [Streptomyces sp. NRRL F-5126]|uniref:DegT/DnrJ/EryC1/StrS family aminotransferase n=1 Tax=Streptomyces sp. NRRL F-5126 TaxID=1463857 RepID=UPI000A7A9482
MARGEGRPEGTAALEALMGRRLGRQCLYTPSCRLALYVALRHWCGPGGRVLMSSVNDDVIFFVVLAAGLRPVQAPLDPVDGSIDVAAVPEETWRGLSAVITTNLYGNPDPVAALRARCDAAGIPLIEDAAHAIGSRLPDGRAVGTVGDAAAFSLSKHVGAKTGGFLAFAEPGLRPELTALRDALLEPAALGSEALYAVRPYAEAGVRGLRLVRAAHLALRLLGAEERQEIRMPLRAGELRRAVAAAPGLDPFESWVRVDMHPYRVAPGRVRLRRTARLLGDLDRRLALHRAGTAALLRSRWGSGHGEPGAGGTRTQPLFRVPLLVSDRDAAIAALARRHITVGYLYDPPLDVYAAGNDPDSSAAFTDPSPLPRPAAWFARHALPVDPCRADEVLRVLDGLPITPVRPPAAVTRDGAAEGSGGGG